MWLGGQDPGWDTSSLVASQSQSRSRSRLGYLKFCGLAVKIPVGISQVCGFAVKIPVGISRVCGFAIKIPDGIPQVCVFAKKIPVEIPEVCGFLVKVPVAVPQDWWLRGQDISRLGYLKFVASWSGPRSGYLKFCGFAVKISSFVVRLPVRISKFCGFAVKIPVGIPRSQHSGWDYLKFVASQSRSRWDIPHILWLRGQDPGWDTSSVWLRGQDPGWDASSVVASWSGSRWGYPKFGVAVKITVGTRQVCGLAIKILVVGIP